MVRDDGQILWRDIGGERDYHAAFIAALPSTVEHTSLHTHDFHEVMLVLEGGGLHAINGAEEALRPRDMLLIRPHDRHAIATRGGQSLHFINIAWHSSAWRDFGLFAGLGEELQRWDILAGPPSVRVPRERFAACRHAFDQILSAFHEGSETVPRPAARLELAAFWAVVVSLLAGIGHPDDNELAGGETSGAAARLWPTWLSQACHAMRGDNLQLGLPRFVELAGVTPEHLGRTLRACSGFTPTEWINQRRLQQAALMLVTTPNPVSDIALDCGFSNLSYFHRLFRKRYGESPRGYRLQAARQVAPWQESP